MKTFKAQFGNVTCEIKTTDTPPQKGERHIQSVEWTGKVTPALLRPYIAWMNSVNQTLANEWGIKMMHVFQLSKGWERVEVWEYEPNGKPTIIPMKSILGKRSPGIDPLQG
jgi:hypothetical protein